VRPGKLSQFETALESGLAVVGFNSVKVVEIDGSYIVLIK
jgi:hypothetical protein